MTRIKRSPSKPMINFAYILMVFTLSRMFAVGMSFESSLWFQLAVVFTISIIIRFLMVRPLYLFALFILSLLSVEVISLAKVDLYSYLRDRLFDLINNVINNLSGAENISQYNRLPLWIALVFLLAFFTAFVIFKNRNRLLLPVLYIPILFIYWYSFYDHAYLLTLLFIFSYLLLLGYDSLLKTTDNLGQKQSEKTDTMYPGWMNIVISYSVIISLLSFGLPDNTDYIKWPWLNEKLTSRYPILEELRSAESGRRSSGLAISFDFSTTGFQTDPSQLGGPVKLDETVIMTIRGDDVNYLRGNILHHYTSRGWESEPLTFSSSEKNTEFSSIDENEKSLYYQQVNFSVTNENMSSTTLFSPYLPASFDIDEEASVLFNQDYSLVYPEGIYNGESYSIRAYQPRSYGILVAEGIDYGIEDLKRKDLYLDLPEDRISERTIQLTDSIAVGQSSLEKALAIEDYLRNNYTYSLDVSHLPDGEDFVDYFLFQEPEGYCTYYATAMTVMLRLQDIPARYVEGFLVEAGQEEGIQEVRNSNAHTWVEAYIEPVGWMLFEPTPSYSQPARLLDYSPGGNEEANNESSEGISRDPETADGRDENIVNGSENGSDNPNSQSPAFFMSISWFALWTFVMITLLLLRSILKGVSVKRTRRMNYVSSSSVNKVVYQYDQISQLIQELGFRIHTGETHFEYSARVAHKFHDFNKFGFKEATDLFVKTKYGNHVPSSEDIESMEAYRLKLENQLKRYLGLQSYYLNKFKKLIKLGKLERK